MAGHKDKPPRSISIVDDPAYWRALGEFIERFAIVEDVLFNYVARIIPATSTVSRAILPGTRTGELCECIRRIWEADENWHAHPETGLPLSEIHFLQKKELDPVLSHLKAINTVRNSLVHYATFTTSDKGRISSNVGRAITPEGIKEHRATPTILNQMTADLGKVGRHLLTFIVTWKNPFAESVRDWPALNDTWQYKPELDQQSPAHKQTRPRKNGQARKTPL